MKKFLLIYLLLLPSIIFAEEWVDLFKDGQIFYKKDSMERINGNIRFIFYVDVEGGSIKNYSEVNCSDQSLRFLNKIFYSEHGLNGKIIGTKEAGEWEYPPPDTYIGFTIKMACKLDLK